MARVAGLRPLPSAGKSIPSPRRIGPIAAAAAAIVFAGCSALREPTPTGPGPIPSESGPSPGKEGGSFRTAIVIRGSTEDDGVPAEYAWIRQHLPGYKLGAQRLEHDDGKAFDVFDIVSPGGEKMKLYLDISAFFGKFEAPEPAEDPAPPPGSRP